MNSDDLYDQIKDNEDNDNDFDDDFDDIDDNKTKNKKVREIKISRKKILFSFLIITFIILSVTSIIVFFIIKNDNPPVAKIVHIESNNQDNKAIAKYGNMITLSFTFDKEIKNTPTVIINDKNVRVYGSKRKFYANYFVEVQDYHDVIVTFTIEDYKDMFGKTGEKIHNTTDLSRVTIPSY